MKVALFNIISSSSIVIPEFIFFSSQKFPFSLVTNADIHKAQFMLQTWTSMKADNHDPNFFILASLSFVILRKHFFYPTFLTSIISASWKVPWSYFYTFVSNLNNYTPIPSIHPLPKPSSLQQLNYVHHIALHFTTDETFCTHHLSLAKVGGLQRRTNHLIILIYIYKTLVLMFLHSFIS